MCAIQKLRSWKQFTIVLLVIAAAALFAGPAPLGAQGTAPPLSEASGPENTLGSQSDTDIWRALRQGAAGLPTTARPGDGVLVNAEGAWWALQRRPGAPLIVYGGIGLLAIIAALVILFLVRGTLRIDEGRSGRMIARFSLAHRVVHWSIASLFVLMALSGLTILFGRSYLIPVVGKSAFGVMATAMMQMHNLFGPVFIASLLALLVTFVRGNFPVFRDIVWLLRGGGLLGRHVSAGRYNAGEKIWFWVAVLAGLALSVTGILLSFPDALGTRNLLHKAELTHAIAALIFIGFALGHIYLGTIGTEGALEGMANGDVDENWARTHHDRWLAQVDAKPQPEADKS